MKYNIYINQEALTRLSPDISTSEAIILDYLFWFCHSKNEKIESHRDNGYTWVNYKTMLKDLPILRLKSEVSFVEKIKNLGLFLNCVIYCI